MKSMPFSNLTGPALSLLGAGVLNAQQLAFPTAEGYGKYTVGGRGGAVYEVTTLEPTGPGSLGEAIDASGPRTVVFRVGGNIEGSFDISNGSITIAGQTAPGDGIAIIGNLTTHADEVIVRYIRVRAMATGDAVSGGHGNKNLIFDHVSASCSSDEVFSIYRNENVTFQYCMVSLPCGGGHRFAGIWGNSPGTYHHNMIAHSDSRNPRWASKGGAGENDYRNNVLYNWGYMSCYGGAGSEPVNMVANYYKPGPATEAGVRSLIAAPSGGAWYVADNVMVGSPEVTQDNWKGMDGGNRVDEPWPAMPINQETAEEAFETVLEHAGCSFPKRDAVDARIVEEARTGTATYGNNGIIDHPDDIGGWPDLKSGEAPADVDHDGMPDGWEIQNELNPEDPADGSQIGRGGYTNLENYLNGLLPWNAPTSIEDLNKSGISLGPGLSDFFGPTANLELFLPYREKVKLEVFDFTGEAVAVLVDEVKDAGVYSVGLAGAHLRSGLYVFRLTSADETLARKFFVSMR